MESKESMGLPSPGPAGVTGSLNGPHQRNGEGSLPGGPSAPTAHSAPHSAPIPVAPIASRPQGPISDAAKAIAAPIVTSVSSTPPPPHLINAPPSYTPDMSCAIVPHSAGVLNTGNHSAGFNLTSGAISFGGGSEQPVRKKRGRPRKYGPHGSIALSVTPLSSVPSPMSPSSRRGRGRPPGSGKNQQLAALGELMLGSAGAGFTPHAITVAAGEDVAARIMSFSQQGPRGICILSANGAISNVTLRQPAISGGTVTYEGRFEILSLSGSFLLTESGGTRSRTGGLSVSLAGPDGRVVGGGVAGMLMAASPVQVVVGSFTYNSSRIQQPRPSNIGVHTGFSKLFPLSSPNIGNSAPELSMTDVADIKPTVSESPPFNQSTGAAASSNADSPRRQEDD